MDLEKIQLHGFNNLTKSLSFNIYDICYAKTEQQQRRYIEYIDEMYNAERLTQILSDVNAIIGAQILNIARQDYEPQGASVTMLISEGHEVPSMVGNMEEPGPLPDSVVAHLNKSHITVHTYPESHPYGGIRPRPASGAGPGRPGHQGHDPGRRRRLRPGRRLLRPPEPPGLRLRGRVLLRPDQRGPEDSPLKRATPFAAGTSVNPD